MSGVSVLDSEGVSTESGISPAPEHRVDLDPEEAMRGVDNMLEFAINLINENH